MPLCAMYHTARSDPIFSHIYLLVSPLIDGLEIMAQMRSYIIFLFKPKTIKDDFRLYYELLKKSYRGRHHS
jgi:hypothetical protein